MLKNYEKVKKTYFNEILQIYFWDSFPIFSLFILVIWLFVGEVSEHAYFILYTCHGNQFLSWYFIGRLIICLIRRPDTCSANMTLYTES